MQTVTQRINYLKLLDYDGLLSICAFQTKVGQTGSMCDQVSVGIVTEQNALESLEHFHYLRPHKVFLLFCNGILNVLFLKKCIISISISIITFGLKIVFRHVSISALGKHHFSPDRNSTVRGWIAGKVCTVHHGTQTVNPTNSGGPLYFTLSTISNYRIQ